MNIHYTQVEKVAICADIATQLKEFQNAKGEKVNLFNESYSFIPNLLKLEKESITTFH